jgi:hypothetical protein
VLRERFLSVGSLTLGVRARPDSYGELLAGLFKQTLRPRPVRGRGLDATLVITRAPGRQRSRGRPGIPEDGLVVSRRADGRFRLATEMLDAVLDLSQRPGAWRIVVRDSAYSAEAQRTHLSVATHRCLLATGRVHVHAAAILLDGRVSLFVGDRGAGKSTISLWLASHGGKILSDDHVVLRRSGRRFWVSGCEETSRVTPKTEAFVFSRPLAIEAQDFAGSWKKEFRVADFFPSIPFRDYPIHRILFSRVGAQFRVKPMSPHQATLQLIEKTRRAFRFADATDYREFLDYWTTLAGAVPAFELELSPDLRQLRRLVRLLRA